MEQASPPLPSSTLYSYHQDCWLRDLGVYKQRLSATTAFVQQQPAALHSASLSLSLALSLPLALALALSLARSLSLAHV